MKQKKKKNEVKRHQLPQSGNSGVASAGIQQLIDIGISMQRRGDLAKAESIYSQALALAPNNVHLLQLKGSALALRGDWAGSLLHFVNALEIDPRNEVLYESMGKALWAMGRVDDALQALNMGAGVVINPSSIRMLRISMLKQMNREIEALSDVESILSLEPQNTSLLEERIHLLFSLNRTDECLHAVDTLLSGDYRSFRLHMVQGHCFIHQRKYVEAITAFDKASLINPDDPAPRFNKALLYLTMGAYKQGWELLESRWELTAMQTQIPAFSSRRWDGLRPLDSPLIVIAEQGLGDSIQFVRYLEPLKGDGVEVELLVQPPLVALFQSSFPDVHVRPVDAHIADRSQICPLMSLPLMAQRRSLDQPARSPYLKVDPDRLLKWRRSIDQFVGPKIGVVWRGGSRFKSDLKRSIDLETFRMIFECHGLNFFSLQKELPNTELQILEGELKATVHNCADQLDDFSDTAALCQCLDLVISVDTAVAHLASALGIQTLILLPFISDWRWGVDSGRTAWYPNARLIRQQQHNDWNTVLDEVKGIIFDQFALAHRP